MAQISCDLFAFNIYSTKGNHKQKSHTKQLLSCNVYFAGNYTNHNNFKMKTLPQDSLKSLEKRLPKLSI